VKHLYTLGAASLHCPSKVGKRIFLLVQSVLTPSEQLGEPFFFLGMDAHLSQYSYHVHVIFSKSETHIQDLFRNLP